MKQQIDIADLLGPLADHFASGLVPWWRCTHDGLSSLPALATAGSAAGTCPECDLQRAEVGVSLATTVLRDLAQLGLEPRRPLSPEQLCVHDWTDRGSVGDQWQECWLCGTTRDKAAELDRAEDSVDTEADTGAGTVVEQHECDAGDFDRTVCGCGWMHSYCTLCGARAEACSAA